MSTALYRRYRPETFADVIGQEHVTDPLRSALRSDRITHAYLFSGPRGCGKTTSARIFARCLNCAQGPTDTPCGTCPSCVDLARDGAGSLDVVEMDAASHGGVDDARELRERAAFAPARDRYKVFIIDEAHMVTNQGFNALLKLVEEPPAHVKFVFATTEPEKVIGTIRSRTHHYPFRLVPPERLQGYLEELCAAEGVAVATGVLPLVVRAGGGSVRDSLSVLDQLIAGAQDGEVSYERAVALLGYTHATLLDDVVDALAARDGASLFRVVDRVIDSGHDPRRFAEDLLERIRDLVVIAVSGEHAGAVLRSLAKDQLDRMRLQSQQLGPAELSRAGDLVNDALTEMSGATSPRLQLELMCARLLLPGADDAARGHAARLDRIERHLSAGGGVPAQPSAGRAALAAARPDPSGAAEPSTAASSAAPGAAALSPSPPARPAVADAAPAHPARAQSRPAHPAADAVADDPARAQSRPVHPVADAVADEPARTQSRPAQPAAEAVADEPARAESRPAHPAAAEPEHHAAPAEPASAAPRVPQQPDGSVELSSAAPAGTPERDEPAQPEPVATVQPGAWSAVPEPAATQHPPEQTRGPQPTPAPEEAPQPGPGPSAAGPDADLIRRRWPEVLSTLARFKRSTWALVSQNAQVGEVSGGVLHLAFATSGLAHTFGAGAHTEPLQRALLETLGVQVRIEPVLSQAASGGQTETPAAYAGGWAAAPSDSAPGAGGAASPPTAASPPAPSAATDVPARGAAPQPAVDWAAPSPEQPAAQAPASAPPQEPPGNEADGPRTASQTGPAPQAPSGRSPASAASPASATDPGVVARVSLADDTPSMDDPDAENSGLVGAPLIERMLGGTVISEE